MKFKLLATAALASTMAIGGAMAQNSGGQDGDIQPDYASDQEQTMYQDNSEMMAPFFTDDSMSELKPEDDVKATFEAMGAESQAAMKSACENAQSDRGSYGSVTVSLCEQVGAM